MIKNSTSLKGRRLQNLFYKMVHSICGKSSEFYGLLFCIAVILLLADVQNVHAQNAIVIENAIPGNPKSEWDVTGAGDLSIQGFATDMSVNKGATIGFKINVVGAVNYNLKIYRLGYYQGNGARLITDLGSLAGISQPNPITNSTTGLVDCGNWAESASWAVPANAVSGIYIAKLTRSDTQGSSHIVFVVRDDSGNSNLLFKTSDATWQAYNVYGGNSLYVGNTSFPSGHAAKVSYNRPFVTRNGGGGGGAMEDWVFNAEYPMLRWLERNGYDISYTTDLDMDRDQSAVTPAIHKVMMSVGHNEYWSAGQRAKFENARNAGVNLAFFSGNEVYWKTRWESSIDGSNTPHRTLVCYKEGTMGENVCNGKCDPLADVWTGLWRDGCAFPNADGCRPENALSGQISWGDVTSAITVGAEFKSLPFWRNTSIANLAAEQSVTLTPGTIGYEWDAYEPAYASYYPAGRVTLSNTTVAGKTHELSLYRHSSGSLVFGAGTVQWSWGLDNDHDRGNAAPSKDMQQATVNLFADMSAQPGTLQPDLVPAVKTTDNTAAATTITFPKNGNPVVQGTPINITGTSIDGGNGTITGIQVSTNGGVTWEDASGTNNWLFSWNPPASGTVIIKARSVDANGNIEVPGAVPSKNAISVTVSPSSSAVYSIWNVSDVPQTLADPDATPIEVGVKFRSTINGFIKGIRFYKSVGNAGVHIGNLWSVAGTNLAQATFTAETASGWQEVIFSNPVSITAGITYVASYHTNTGHYSLTQNYFANTGASSTNLQALASGVDGANGLYKYSSAAAFPTSSYQSTNYWVDVVFTTTNGPDVTPPIVLSISPLNTANGININSAVTVTFNEAIGGSTLTASTFELRNAANAVVPAIITYDPATRIAALTPSAPLTNSSQYTVTVKGGASGNRVADLAGNFLAADFVSTFTTSAPIVIPPLPTEGPGGPILIISSSTNPFSRYPVEILRAEGLNEFFAMDITEINAAVLAKYEVVILGDMQLSAAEVTLLTDWTTQGGTLIAMKPDAQLANLLGITLAGGSLSNKYLSINAASAAGAGITQQTMQFHGAATLYNLNGATSLATLYANATTPTLHPAVTLIDVGTKGGQAIAFTYDLARSIVYTRQGNPDWAGQKRDGQIDPIRSDDLYYGNASFDPQPDWVDFSKVAIPQADEQQRLLTNIVMQGNLDKKPLPRLWFLPKGLKAAVVMTGDDHGNGGTIARFNHYKALSTSNSPDAVADWTAIRGTSYIYPNTPISNAQVIGYQNDGFEISMHLNTNCANFTESSLSIDLTSQWNSLSTNFPGINAQTTHRIHCLAWSDWSSEPKVEALRGIRLNTTYYYWPGAWINDKPGMFTGSGLPMRFADLNGNLIDSYQVTTQITDESGINVANHIALLLNNATNALGYYGVFCANMHTDADVSDGSEAIIAAAKAKQIPVVSANQMLTWLDGRNNSSFNSMSWADKKLSFKITTALGSRNMLAMLPVNVSNGNLNTITYNGSQITFTTEAIKGIQYAFFDATKGNGTYEGNYNANTTGPVISEINSTFNNDGSVAISWKTNVASTSRVDYNLAPGPLSLNASNASLVTDHSITLTGLLSGETYNYRITSIDASNNKSTNPVLPDSISLIIPAGPCITDIVASDFNLGTISSSILVSAQGDGAVMLKPILNADFEGSSIPTGFNSSAFTNPAGTTISNGTLRVDGTHVYSNASYGPGSSLEFLATFNPGSFQNIGFTSDQGFDNDPWITIGQGASIDGNLYARSFANASINLGANLLGSPHLYKISWNTDNTFSFYVDGVLIATPDISSTINTPMFIQISDYTTNDGALLVDWLRLAPYATSGSFTSRIFDSGALKNWGNATWTADIPVGTGLEILVRKGNTPLPDSTWTAFTTINSSGLSVGGRSRYVQYQANLTGTGNATPILKDMVITCTGARVALAVITHPVSQTICVGNPVSFAAEVSGSPTPSVQWQVSTNNSIYTNIAGQNAPVLTLTTTALLNNYKYRAVFTNTLESIITNPAALTVNTDIQITQQPLNAAVTSFGNASFVTTVTGADVNYKWQVSTDQGVTFTDIANNTVYSGTTTNTLNLTGVVGSYNNYLYRSVITGICTAFSNAASLTVTKANPVITWNAPSAVIYGTPLTDSILNATVLLPSGGAASGLVTYSTASGTVLNAGTYALTVTVAATTDYNSATKTVNLLVSKKTVIPVVTAASKEYTGTTGTAISTRSLTGVLPADAGNIILIGGTATFSNPNAGIAKAVAITALSISGSAIGNYILSTAPLSTTADIRPRPVSVVMTISSKVYDGTAAATITSTTLGRILTVDVGKIALGVGTATFSSRTAATSKAVTGTGFSLTGTAALNYILPTTVTATAAISKLTIVGSVTIANKVYSGTTPATIATRTLTGVLTIDNGLVTLSSGTAVFSNANVANGIPVSVTGLTLAGTSAANYSLTSTAVFASGNITPKSVTGTITASSKVYDGNNLATIATRALSGLITIDAGNVVLTGGTAVFSSAAVGSLKVVTATGLSLSGTAAPNYFLSATSLSARANITTRLITVTANSGQRKVVGTANPVYTYSVTSGSVVAGENFTGVLTRTAGEAVGNYAILRGTLSIGSNYTLTYVGANFSIVSALQLASLSPATKVSFENSWNVADFTEEINLKAYPNPFGKHTNVAFKVVKDEDRVIVEVYNLNGLRINGLYDGKALRNKTYNLDFDGSKMPPGIYIIRLTNGVELKTIKVIMLE